MANEKHNRRDSDWLHEIDDLGRELDAALAKYAAAEPRAGLEERILENLRAEQTHVPDRTWWHWAIAGALAAVIIVGVALAWRSARPSPPTIANRPQPSTQESQKSGTQVAAHEGGATHPRRHDPIRRPTAHPPSTTAVGANSPKLDQFPSPQPLSEQEKILASYVNQFPDHAALLAQARMEMLRRDREEELRQAGADSTQDSQPQ
jgi:hypothetical protein